MDHSPVFVTPDTEPDKTTLRLLTQIVWSTPASTIGDGSIVINTLSDTMLQFKFPVDWSVNVTVPAVISAEVGVYVPPKSVFEGVNVPDPPTHWPPEDTVIFPFSVTVGLFSHEFKSNPASATGDGVKLMVTSSVTVLQTPTPVVVNVIVTDPFVISVAVGVYEVFKALLLREKVPNAPVHCPPLAPVTDPIKFTVELFPQTDWSKPASAVGAGIIEIATSSVTAIQLPFPVDVNVNVVVPAVISAFEGV